MTDLEFASLTIENFTVFTKPQKLSFGRLGLGLTFMQAFNKVEPDLGSNGSGKSSVFDAFKWCLYGKTIDGRRGTDVRPWSDPKAHTYVTLVVYVNDEKRIIERSTKTNGLTLDDKVVTQDEIIRLIGITEAMFDYAVVIGQGAEMFFELTPGAKMAMLSEAIDLSNWDKHSENAKARRDDLFKAQGEAKAQIAILEQVLADLKRDRDDVAAKAVEWDDRQSAALAEAKKDMSKNIEVLDQWRIELGRHDLDYEAAETELRAAASKVTEVAKKLREAQTVYDRASDRLQAADAKLADLKDTTFEESCPTCGATINHKTRRDHEKKLREEIKDQEDECDDAYQAAKDAGIVMADLKTALDKHEADVTTYRRKSDDAIDARTRKQTQVSELAATVAFNKKQADLKQERNPYDDLARDIKARIRTTIDTLKELDAVEELAAVKANRNDYWVKNFKTIKLHLLEEFLNELEVVTQDTLPRLGLVGWDIRITMEKETKSGVNVALHVMIRKPEWDKPVKWEAFSGGEAQRLKLAGAIALSDTLLQHAGVRTDLMVLDEPTQHLSPEGVGDLVDTLIEVGRNRQMILIDHTARQSNRFANTVTVTRNRDGSTIEARAWGA